MKNRRRLHGLTATVGVFRDVWALVGVLILPQHLAPAPVPGVRLSGSGGTGRTPLYRRTGWLAPLVVFVLLAAVPAWAGQPALPSGVPDLRDPGVRAHYQPVGVESLGDNPDLPAVLLLNTTGDQPLALLLGLDARNGTTTWSLVSDPIILIVVFANPTTIQGMYVDTGFAKQGKASGTYTPVDKGNPAVLSDLLKAVAAAGTRTEI
ncbi:MAG TPA: hypothetical protein VEU07_00950 [Candidatus Acidoferrum sp.]|nr:hypothetical protein [Candidatus Acidoferrum sp.]